MPPALLSDFYNLSQTASSSARHKAETIYAAVVDTFFLDYKLPDGVSPLARKDDSGRVIANGLNKQKSLVTQIVVYPNPASDVVNFMNLKGASHLTIKDITGRTILNIDNNDNVYHWKTTNVSNGVYFYTIFNDDNVMATGKVVISK